MRERARNRSEEEEQGKTQRPEAASDGGPECEHPHRVEPDVSPGGVQQRIGQQRRKAGAVVERAGIPQESRGGKRVGIAGGALD